MKCNFCGSSDAKIFLKLSDYRLHIPGQWELMQCMECGLFYLWPQPDWEELSAHYPQKYHAYITTTSRKLQRLRNYGLRKRVNSILNYKNSWGVILDIGCASGDFLKAFESIAHWQIVGLEVVPDAIKIARQKGIPVLTERLPDANLPDESFDVVTLWDVLEHLPNPSEILNECFRILKSGGLLVIKTPDPTGGEANLFKYFWAGYETPKHLFVFPQHVLNKHLEEIGFYVDKTEQTGSDYAAFFLSLGFWLQNHGISRIGQYLINLIHTFAGRVIAAVAVKPLRILGFRSSYTYYAFKK